MSSGGELIVVFDLGDFIQDYEDHGVQKTTVSHGAMAIYFPNLNWNGFKNWIQHTLKKKDGSGIVIDEEKWKDLVEKNEYRY